MLAIDQWRLYLQHTEFMIWSDQKSLVHLDDQRLTTDWQYKALTKLSGLRYRMIYKKGVENKAVDALSHKSTCISRDLVAVSMCVPSWLTKVVNGYESDVPTKNMLTQLSMKDVMHPKFQLQDGLLCYAGHVRVGANTPMQQKIITAMHASAIGGHSGFQLTYNRVRKLFTWPGMKKGIQTFVSAYSICK